MEQLFQHKSHPDKKEGEIYAGGAGLREADLLFD